MDWGSMGLRMHAVAISLGQAVLEASSKRLGSCAFQLGAYTCWAQPEELVVLLDEPEEQGPYWHPPCRQTVASR